MGRIMAKAYNLTRKRWNLLYRSNKNPKLYLKKGLQKWKKVFGQKSDAVY